MPQHYLVDRREPPKKSIEIVGLIEPLIPVARSLAAATVLGTSLERAISIMGLPTDILATTCPK